MWEDRFGTEAQLQEHLREKHAHVLEPICERMLRCNAPDVLYSVYCEALAVKCRSLPPHCRLFTGPHSFAHFHGRHFG